MNVYRQGEQRGDFFSLLLIICPVVGCAGSWIRLYCLKQWFPTCDPGMSVGMYGGCRASTAAAAPDNENLGTGTSGGMPG